MTRPDKGHIQTGHGGDASTLVCKNSIQDWPSGLSYRNPTGRSSPVLLGHRQGGLYSSQNAPLPLSFIDLADLAHRNSSIGSVLSQEHETTGVEVCRTRRLGNHTHEKRKK